MIQNRVPNIKFGFINPKSQTLKGCLHIDLTDEEGTPLFFKTLENAQTVMHKQELVLFPSEKVTLEQLKAFKVGDFVMFDLELSASEIHIEREAAKNTAYSISLAKPKSKTAVPK